MPTKETKQERLARLREEMEELEAEPDPPQKTRADNLNITIDLGDETQVKRALKLGLLEKGDLDEFDDPATENGDGEEEAEDPPRRKQRYE